MSRYIHRAVLSTHTTNLYRTGDGRTARAAFCRGDGHRAAGRHERDGDWHAPKKLKGKKTRDPWAPSSINPTLARLRSVFDDLVNQGMLTRNVAALVKPVLKHKREMKSLTAAEVSAYLGARANTAMGIGYRLALKGMRRGEVLGLSWAAVDFDAGTLTIAASRAPIAGGVATGETKTKGSVRTLPMPAELVTALRAERRRHPATSIRAAVSPPAGSDTAMRAFTLSVYGHSQDSSISLNTGALTLVDDDRCRMGSRP